MCKNMGQFIFSIPVTLETLIQDVQRVEDECRQKEPQLGRAQQILRYRSQVRGINHGHVKRIVAKNLVFHPCNIHVVATPLFYIFCSPMSAYPRFLTGEFKPKNIMGEKAPAHCL